jgi:CubicO group peptidase (beta-lactamase class C family)
MSFSFSKAKTAITPRHLLCHTSGLTYDELDTRIHAWRTFQDKDFSFEKNPIPISCGQPLSFEPDQGWAYGPSLDWASLLVRRLNGDITFEQYLIDNIWIPLGQKAPFPTFDLDKHLEYKAKVVQLDDHKASEHEKAGNPELGGTICRVPA